ncbi:MAG: C2H2-type zinc finger protein [Candidatus Bathyarchaeia archaeon]
MSFLCPFCDERFESQDEVNKHLRRRHRDKVRLVRFEHPEREKDCS